MTDMTARNGPLLGREAYEADLALNPTYHTGEPRPSWDALGPLQFTWERPVRPIPDGPVIMAEGARD
jgi:hypothetical protein